MLHLVIGLIAVGLLGRKLFLEAFDFLLHLVRCAGLQQVALVLGGVKDSHIVIAALILGFGVRGERARCKLE